MSKKLIYGVDVSTHQGKINWELVRQNKDFAIIRGGQNLKIDGWAKVNFPAAKTAGMPRIGMYWYSYPHGDIQHVVAEAHKCVEVANMFPDTLNMPIFYDLEQGEEGTKTPEFVQQCVRTFADIVIGAGYKAGMYYNVDYFVRYYNVNGWYDRQTDLTKWLAQYNPVATRPWEIWQYSSTGRVPGINTDVDLDQMYVDDDPPVPPIGIDPVILMAEVNKNGKKRIVTNWF